MGEVPYLRIVLVFVNALAFLVVLAFAIKLRRRERNARVRRLWLTMGLICAALVLGSLQRLALQAISLSWLPQSTETALLDDFQFIQSLLVLALIVGVFLNLRKLSESMGMSERLTGSLLNRVRHVDPRNLNLTKREKEVLALIGEGVTTDAELSAELHISPSTVQSHVKSLLRKTELNSRKDLLAVALLIYSPGE